MPMQCDEHSDYYTRIRYAHKIASCQWQHCNRVQMHMSDWQCVAAAADCMLAVVCHTVCCDSTKHAIRE